VTLAVVNLPAGGGGGSPKSPDPTLTALQTSKQYDDFPKLKGDATSVQAIVTKKEILSPSFALTPHETDLYKPNVSPTYAPNTYILNTLGAAGQDNTTQVIQTAGGIVTGLLPLLLGAPKAPPPPAANVAPLSLPVVIDLSGLDFGGTKCIYKKGNPDVVDWCPIDRNKGWLYSAEVNAAGVPNSVQRDTFFTSIGTATTRMFPVPVCQPLTLHVTDENTKAESVTYQITVANPNKVSGMLIPAKGSISMTNNCGADISVTGSPTTGTLDVINAVLTQVEAIYKAQQTAKPK
jgi:hypothetical protein